MIPSNTSKPHSDMFDPRSTQQRSKTTWEQKIDFGLKLQQISDNAQALDILLDPDTIRPSLQQNSSPEIKNLVIFVSQSDCDKEGNIEMLSTTFLESFSYSASEVSEILEKTSGQACNKLWFEVRKGLLTASNFEQACKYIDQERPPSSTFMKQLLGEIQIDDQNLPPPLKWGRQKESVARAMYQRCFKRNHKHFKVIEKGLLISEKFPVLGCSVDGVCICRCTPKHPKRIIEIKCPFSHRFSNPKDVAVLNHCKFDDVKGEWLVTPKCPYYAQIQGQLGIYGHQYADLVIYTKCGIYVSSVTFDREYFSNMIDKLTLFHKKYLAPAIIKKCILA